jgi:hypothetical protein
MFNPPIGVTDGAEYTYGNIVWRYEHASGVWNIVDGSVVGSQGPKGDQGDPGAPGAQGNTGNTGPTGAGATGDNGAFIVTNEVGTVRIATTGATGVASFDPRFFSLGTSGHIKLGGSLGGIQIQDGYKQGDIYSWGESIEILGATGVDFRRSGKGEFTVYGLTATHAKPGVASFDATFFTISSTGNVDLASAYAATGDTIQAGSAINIGTGKVINNIGVTAFNGATGAMTVTGSQHGIPYINTSFGAQGGLTATSNLLFNGTSLTFGTAAGSKITITGTGMLLGANMSITGGIFRNPAEASPVYTLASGVNEVVVNGASGTIQRYNISPNATVTIKAGSAWHSLSTTVETIAVIIKQNSGNGYTGQFDSSILTDGLTRPILFSPDTVTNAAITGSVAMVTLMRVQKTAGGLTMGFVIASGITGSGVEIS